MPRLILIINILIVVIIVIVGLFLWFPQFQKFRDFKVELDFRKQELEQKIEYFKKLKTVENKLKDYEKELFMMDYSIPDDPLLPDLFYFIEKLAVENGLILKSITYPSGTGVGISMEGEVENIPLSVVLYGSYNSFKRFLSSIYESSRIIEVKTISFSPVEDKTEDRSVFNYNLSLESLYYSRPPN